MELFYILIRKNYRKALDEFLLEHDFVFIKELINPPKKFVIFKPKLKLQIESICEFRLLTVNGS